MIEKAKRQVRVWFKKIKSNFVILKTKMFRNWSKFQSRFSGSKFGPARRFIAGALAGLILILVLGLSIFGAGLYRYGWNDPSANEVIKIFPYPAALVNYEIIPYADFRDQVGTLTHYFQKQVELIAGVKMPAPEEIRQEVLDRLIKIKLAEQLARVYRISVDQSEVEAEFNKAVDEAGGKDNVGGVLANLYNWTPNQFKEKVLRPFLIQKKLAQAISNDPDLNKGAEKRATMVLKLVKAGKESFNDLAKKYSEDPGTASRGGELGFFGRGTMVKEFEEAAFALKPGETSGLIKTIFGYHIIRVEERKVDPVSKTEEIRAQHILIKTEDLANYLKDFETKSRIYQFI